MRTVKLLNKILTFFLICSLGLLAYTYLTEKPEEFVNGVVKRLPKKYTKRYQEQLPVEETDVETEINAFRQSQGLEPLGKWEPLCDFAKIRVYEIKEDFSHAGFEERTINFGEGSVYEQFCDKDSVKCTRAGENLAKGYYESKEVVQGWADSPGHRKNMLGEYNVQCVAVDGGYVVSLFAFTQDLSNILPIGPKPTDNVTYNYEKVLLWEQIKNNHIEYKQSWEEAYDSEYYKGAELDSLIIVFEDMIALANYLWDGYTNSKITYEQAKLAEIEFIQKQDRTQELIQQNYQTAYNTCIKDFENLEKEHNEDYSDEKEQCNQFLENIE